MIPWHFRLIGGIGLLVVLLVSCGVEDSANGTNEAEIRQARTICQDASSIPPPAGSGSRSERLAASKVYEDAWIETHRRAKEAALLKDAASKLAKASPVNPYDDEWLNAVTEFKIACDKI